MAKKTKHSTKNPKMAFRFLDLPPELRNRVYDFVAANATVTIINRKQARKEIPKPHNNPLNGRHKSTLRQVKKVPKRRSVIGLLRTCRQIQNEARAIIESAIGLDLRFVMLASSRMQLKLLRGQWAAKLHLIRHLEFDNDRWWYLLVLGRCDSEYIDAWTSALKSTYGPDCNAEQVLRLRTALVGVESITLRPTGHARYYEEQDIKNGALIAMKLCDKKNREELEKCFPKLVDIKCISKYGGERFKKVDGNWQLYYSGQRLPLSIHKHRQQQDIHSPKMMSKLGLITKKTLRFLGKIPT